MSAEHDRDFSDLNQFRGIGANPLFEAPLFKTQPRLWSLDSWSLAPQAKAYSDFENLHWKGLRILKDPETQATYQNLLWELRPRTIIELGVYSGASLVWFRDMTQLIGLDTQVIGVDILIDRVRIPHSEMTHIALHEGDCRDTTQLGKLKGVQHPILFIDDAHCDTFNIMKWCVNNLLQSGDYFIVEDMIPIWHRYSPIQLSEHLAAFRKVLALDLLYANACPQLHGGVFRSLSSVEEERA